MNECKKEKKKNSSGSDGGGTDNKNIDHAKGTQRNCVCECDGIKSLQTWEMNVLAPRARSFTCTEVCVSFVFVFVFTGFSIPCFVRAFPCVLFPPGVCACVLGFSFELSDTVGQTMRFCCNCNIVSVCLCLCASLDVLWEYSHFIILHYVVP